MKRAARTDGSNEPNSPMTVPNNNPYNISFGVTRKLNAISLNVTKFAVPVETKFNGRVNRIPIAAPTIEIATASNTNAIRMLRRLKPNTRSVPIS